MRFLVWTRTPEAPPTWFATRLPSAALAPPPTAPLPVPGEGEFSQYDEGPSTAGALATVTRLVSGGGTVCVLRCAWVEGNVPPCSITHVVGWI